jgi:hypothetical protein
MKNKNMSKFALLGLTSGLIVSAQAQAHDSVSHELETQPAMLAKGCGAHCGSIASRDRNSSADQFRDDNQATVLTEETLLPQLNERGKALYNSLDAEGKSLAITLASRSCKGLNTCKGLNACKSEKNSCKGQGSCKGTSACKFTDKNDAVKVAAQKMMDKRNNSAK